MVQHKLADSTEAVYLPASAAQVQPAAAPAILLLQLHCLLNV
jgi:hypothetical protein